MSPELARKGLRPGLGCRPEQPMGMKMSQRKFHGFGTDLPARERENYAPRVARSGSAQRSPCSAVGPADAVHCTKALLTGTGALLFCAYWSTAVALNVEGNRGLPYRDLCAVPTESALNLALSPINVDRSSAPFTSLT
ncbi:hypothetical protein LCP963914a_9852 [Penicillium roqueforti]|nr:hypothetical protein LCP963914a_9852 [Penicillium roqueforti]